MHIAILAPSHRSFIINFLPDQDVNKLPLGNSSAPFIGTTITELLSQGHQVTAITTSRALNNHDTVKEYSFGDFKWVVVPQRHHSFRMNGKKPGYILDFFAHEQNQMVGYITDIKPDFVHAHWSYEFAGAAIKSGFPCLVTVHDNALQVLRFFKNLYRLGRLLMSEHLLKQVRFASTVSPYMLPYTERRCQSARVIPNPVLIDLTASEIDAAVLIKSQTLNAPRLIMINNGWNALKNGWCALLAFKQVQQQFPEATLHLFGDGSEANGLANQDAVKLDLRNVIYHGSVPHDQLINELKKAHILIHPALEESFGVVLIEAMSCGVPVIGGMYSGAVPWVINDKRLLVDVTKSEQIKSKLIELLTDLEAYRQVSTQAYANVLTRFSSKSVVNNYLTYYDEILNAW